MVTETNGTAIITGNGPGVQIQILAADGGAEVGGEIVLRSGQSAGGDGGDVTVAAGPDTADGIGGNISIESGGSVDGDGGDISIRANRTAPAGFRGGDINVVAGAGFHGGNVVVQGGGTSGNVQLYSGDGNQAVQLDANGLHVLGTKVGFYSTAPVVQPAAPVTLGDVIAALKALGLVAT